MRTMTSPDPPNARSDRDDYMIDVTVGVRRRIDGPIHLADYDPEWPLHYEREATRVRDLLGERVHMLEHVGS